MSPIKRNKFVMELDEIEVLRERKPSDEELKEAEKVFNTLLKKKKEE